MHYAISPTICNIVQYMYKEVNKLQNLHVNPLFFNVNDSLK